MKCIIVLFLAIASASAFGVRSLEQFIDIAPVMPVVESGSRITNGSPASTGQFPYQVGLLIQTGGGSAWCGGSLISNQWILTAAHCTDGALGVTAHLGSAVRQSGTKAPVVKIIIHENWDPKTLANDISLLQINPVSFTANIKAIALPGNTYTSYAGQTGIISGWGKTKDDGGVVLTLQYASVPIVENSVCSNTYGSAVVKTTNVCVKTSVTKISTCNGDSGGPLVLSNVLIGATSYGAAAGCTKEHPVVFTRVSSYRDWIRAKSNV